jgi:NADPH:quinone reductase-like Zn-dependent oxidoreductase
MPSNQAAWLTAKGTPLTIEPAPLLDPKPNQILIKNRAVAINPVDWAVQGMGQDVFPFLKFPCTLGHDVAGEIVAVGSAVTRVKVGDRVLGFASERGMPTAFQEYTPLADNLFSPIPDSMSFEEASVIPLGLSTSASGMFQKDYLALPYPSVDPKPLGKTLLIWSGASSVGCNAIQLGVAAGCDVITTCSPKNYEIVKKLGASRAFDYSSDTVVNDILTYLEDKTIAGAVGSMSYTPYPYPIEFP